MGFEFDHEEGAVKRELRFLREKQALEMIPLSHSRWWEGVQSGEFPQPVKLTASTTVWLYHEIQEFMQNLVAKQRGAA